jgi:hypothetical protein
MQSAALANPPPSKLSAPAAVLQQQPLHPKLRALLDYWVSIHPAIDLPGRRHLDPIDLPALLPNIWLIDVIRLTGSSAPRLRYRLVGTSVARAFDEDCTGRWLDEVHQGFADSPVRQNLEAVIDSAQPSWRVGRPHLGQLRDYLSLERLYLPLADDGHQVDMILAITVFLDRYGIEF